jgi:hypothetical protein
MGVNISSPVQTGPGAHPTSCTMATGSHHRVKWLERGVDRTPPSIAEIKRVEVPFYSHFGPSWPVLGQNLPLLGVFSYVHLNIQTQVI